MRLRFSNRGLIIFIILSLVFIFHYSGLLFPIENYFVKILTPFSVKFYYFGQKVQNWWKPEISFSDYEKLREERNQLAADVVKLQLLEKENQELKEALNFVKENQFNFLAANVIGRDLVFPNHLVLNKGVRDGVQVNLPVVSSSGILVGKIIKADEKISIMVIPTDSQFQTAGMVLGKSQRITSGLVKGEKGLGIKMEFIPQDEVIEKEDLVVTSGLELNMPKGLIIGKVSEVKREVRNIFSEAILNPLIVYEDLDIVMVLLPQF